MSALGKRWTIGSLFAALAIISLVIFWLRRDTFIESTLLPLISADGLANRRLQGKVLPIVNIQRLSDEPVILASPFVFLIPDEPEGVLDVEHASVGFPLSFDSSGSQLAVLC